MASKYENLLKQTYASMSFVLEADQPQLPPVEQEPAPTAPAPVEFTPTEEQILTALVQKIGPEQLIAKVTQLAQAATPPADKATLPPTPAAKAPLPPLPTA